MPRQEMINAMLSPRTRSLVLFDLRRLQARWSHFRWGKIQPSCDRLHFGCGTRRVAGWVNVDVARSDYNVDLASGSLPWRDDVFSAIVAQQVIEHLDLQKELLPLLRELRRVAKPGAELWLSCPDMEKVCRSYLECRGADLLEDRQARWPDFSLHNTPTQHMINVLFHQGGQHKNLFDFDLLRWTLETAGFCECRRVSEANFLRRFPEFPPRNDDSVSLYVSAVVPQDNHGAVSI